MAGGPEFQRGNSHLPAFMLGTRFAELRHLLEARAVPPHPFTCCSSFFPSLLLCLCLCLSLIPAWSFVFPPAQDGPYSQIMSLYYDGVRAFDNGVRSVHFWDLRSLLQAPGDAVDSLLSVPLALLSGQQLYPDLIWPPLVLIRKACPAPRQSSWIRRCAEAHFYGALPGQDGRRAAQRRCRCADRSPAW
jgi:hypothetical protein